MGGMAGGDKMDISTELSSTWVALKSMILDASWKL